MSTAPQTLAALMPNVPHGKVGSQKEHEEKAGFDGQVVPLGDAAHEPIEFKHLRRGQGVQEGTAWWPCGMGKNSSPCCRRQRLCRSPQTRPS